MPFEEDEETADDTTQDGDKSKEPEKQAGMFCLLILTTNTTLDVVGDKFWEPHLLQFLDHVRDASSTLVTSNGHIRVYQGKGKKLELHVMGTNTIYTSILPLSFTWVKGKVPSKKDLYAKCALTVMFC